MVNQLFPVPAVALKITLKDADELVEEELASNEWNVEWEDPTLELRPYYVFQFDSFSEAEEANTKIRNVEESVQGGSALNAISNSLDDVIAEIVTPEMIQESFSVGKEIKVNQRVPRFGLDDAKVAAQIKIAAQEKVPKANVHISGMRLVHVPFWIYSIELNEDTKVTLKINGVTGEFEGEETGVPYRGKTSGQLVDETLADLHHPAGWIEYIQGFGKDVMLLFQPEKEHPNRWIVIGILVLIALALLLMGFIKLPTPN